MFTIDNFQIVVCGGEIATFTVSEVVDFCNKYNVEFAEWRNLGAVMSEERMVLQGMPAAKNLYEKQNV